jgi:hypothetical protein
MNYDEFTNSELKKLYNKDSCKNTEKLYNEVSDLLKEYFKKAEGIESKKIQELLKIDIESLNDLDHDMSSMVSIFGLVGVTAGLVISTTNYELIKQLYMIIMVLITFVMIKIFMRKFDVYSYKKKVLIVCLKVLENLK